jgi:hypothetical protein
MRDFSFLLASSDFRFILFGAFMFVGKAFFHVAKVSLGPSLSHFYGLCVGRVATVSEFV